MNAKSDLEIWIDHAEDDFNAAGKLLRGRKPSVYGACFHAQQCAEKYMKAILVVKGKRSGAFIFLRSQGALLWRTPGSG